MGFNKPRSAIISQPSANCKHFFTIFEKIFFAVTFSGNTRQKAQDIGAREASVIWLRRDLRLVSAIPSGAAGKPAFALPRGCGTRRSRAIDNRPSPAFLQAFRRLPQTREVASEAKPRMTEGGKTDGEAVIPRRQRRRGTPFVFAAVRLRCGILRLAPAALAQDDGNATFLRIRADGQCPSLRAAARKGSPVQGEPTRVSVFFIIYFLHYI